MNVKFYLAVLGSTFGYLMKSKILCQCGSGIDHCNSAHYTPFENAKWFPILFLNDAKVSFIVQCTKMQWNFNIQTCFSNFFGFSVSRILRGKITF